MSSEFPCISMNLISRARYSSGIQSSHLHLPAGLDVVEELLRARVHCARPPYRTVVSIECMATRREELTREAARLFAERGFHGTSMDALAQALGVQKGSLYSLTGSKQELLFETHARGRGRVSCRTRRGAGRRLGGRADPAGAARSPPRRLRAARLWRPCSSREWRYLEGEHREEILAERRRYEERWRALFREGVEAGGLRTDLDAGAATLLVLSAANWAYTWLEPGRDTDELADRFTAILVDGIRGYATPAVSRLLIVNPFASGWTSTGSRRSGRRFPEARRRG